jgi:hypothetical protein
MSRLTRFTRVIGPVLLVLGLALLLAPTVLAAEGDPAGDPSALTFAALVTPPGMVTAAGFITTLIQLLKGVFPGLDAKVSGALQAFFISLLLYIATGAVLFSNGTFQNADAILWIIGAWLGVATGAVGIKAAFTHAVNAPAKGLPLTDAVDESTTDPVVGEDRPDPRYPS